MAHMHDEKCLNSNKAWTGIVAADKIEYDKGYYVDRADHIKENRKNIMKNTQNKAKNIMKNKQILLKKT